MDMDTLNTEKDLNTSLKMLSKEFESFEKREKDGGKNVISRRQRNEISKCTLYS